MTLQDILAKLPEAFVAENAAGVDATVQLNETAHIVIKDGTCVVNDGTDAGADLSITMEEADMVAMLTGELSGMDAFMGGQLQMDGDPGLAMQMEAWFDASRVM